MAIPKSEFPSFCDAGFSGERRKMKPSLKVFVIALLASSLGWQGQIAWGLEKLTVIYGAIGGGMWPVMVAEKRGIFVKNGLAITFVFVEGGSRAIPKARQAKAEDFIDNRFIRELDESGFIKGLYRR